MRLEEGQLRRQPPARVDGERAAVEHLVVLPADQVEVDQRQSRLDRARHGVLHAHVVLAAFIGRAVRHDQDLGPGLLQRLGDVREPDVLADGEADTAACDLDRTRRRPLEIQPLFVEDAVIRAVVLAEGRPDRAVLQQHQRVVGAGMVLPRLGRRARGSARPRPAPRRPCASPPPGSRSPSGNRAGRRAEPRGRAADSPTGTSPAGHQIRPGLLASPQRLLRQGEIAGQVPRHRVFLHDRDAQAVWL